MSRVASALCPSLLAAGFVHPQFQPGTANKCEGRLGPMNLLRQATKTVRPAYPQEAIRAKATGVVLAELCVPAGGPIAAVTISPTPSEAIARSVKQALARWRFGTWIDNKGRYSAYGGKVIFYFIEQNGEWKVLDPTDSFYAGPRFAIKQPRRAHDSPGTSPSRLGACPPERSTPGPAEDSGTPC
jgi:hypothetical protein